MTEGGVKGGTAVWEMESRGLRGRRQLLNADGGDAEESGNGRSQVAGPGRALLWSECAPHPHIHTLES